MPLHQHGPPPPGVFFGHAHHAGHPFLWLLLLVLFLALVALAIYALVRVTRGGGSAPAAAGPDAAVESVRMRYARGEIDRDEFVRVSTDLGAPPPVTA